MMCLRHFGTLSNEAPELRPDFWSQSGSAGPLLDFPDAKRARTDVFAVDNTPAPDEYVLEVFEDQHGCP